MKIRKVVEKDLEEIARIELNSGYHKRRFNSLSMLRDFFENKRQELFVVTEGINYLGYIGINTDKKVCEIVFLSVSQKYQRRGVGKKLVKYVVSLSKKKKLKKVTLDIRNDNFEAMILYLKYGFVIVGIKRKDNMIKLVMEKKL